MTATRFWNQLQEFALPLGSLQGVPIRLHASFLLVWPLAYFLSGGNLSWSLMFTVMVFVLVLIHECGHLCAARIVRSYHDQMVVWPLGGLVPAETPLRPLAQFFVALAGPVTHLGIGLLFLPWTIDNFPPALWPAPSRMKDLDLFLTLNQMLLIANLVPSFLTDGGRLWQGLLWRFLGFARATIMTAALAIIAAAACAVAAVAGRSIVLAIVGGILLVTTLWHLWRFRIAEVVDGVWVETPALFSVGYRCKHSLARLRDWYGKRRQERDHLRRVKEAQALDALLHKITMVGLAGLTNRERRFLQRQSDRLQRKRGIPYGRSR
jgi:Zn-dependent protease